MAARITSESQAQRMKALESAVRSGWSYNEIRRTLGIDYRTVKKYYPDYKPFPVGGGGDAAIIRRVNQDLREFERRGKIGKHRENGFKPKET